MKITNTESVVALAKQIGKSKKESIIINGNVYIKSCKIGLWNSVVVCEYDDINYIKNEVVGRKYCVSSKHRCKYSASLSIESSITDHIKFKKDTGHDLKAKYKIIDLIR